MSQRIHIVIEDGRVEILVNDGEAVVINSKPTPTDDVSKNPPKEQVLDTPVEPVLDQSTTIETPVSSVVHYHRETSPPPPPKLKEPDGLDYLRHPQTSPPDDRVKKAVDLGIAIAEHVANAPVDDTQRPPFARDIDVPNKPERTCTNCGGDISYMDKRALYCRNPECVKEKRRAYNSKYRASLGQAVGVGRGHGVARQKTKAGNPREQLQPNDAIPRLADEAPPAQTYIRSKCCEAKTELVEADPAEPDNRPFRRCLACMNECETYEYTPPFQDLWDCAACREAGRFCRLHAALNKDGSKPIMGRPPQ